MSGQALNDIRDMRRRMMRLSETYSAICYEVSTPGGMRYDKIRVQTSPVNRLETGVVRMEMIRRAMEVLRAEIDAKTSRIEMMQASMGIFTPDEWAVLKCRYFEAYDYERTESVTGFSESKVRKLIQRIRKKGEIFS